jgi:hypothetical protein
VLPAVRSPTWWCPATDAVAPGRRGGYDEAMTTQGTWIRSARARIALGALLLMLFSVTDGFLCGSEAIAHGSTVVAAEADHHDAGGKSTDCVYGHCHHLMPMPVAGEAKTATMVHAVFVPRVPPALDSIPPPSLDRPPKA